MRRHFDLQMSGQQRLDHLVLDTALLTNPLRVSHYQEEDLVGRIKMLAVVENPNHLGKAVLDRWSWHAAVIWENRRLAALESSSDSD